MKTTTFNQKIKTLRQATYEESINMLDTYGKCCIIRPTGFGKTGILTRILKDYVNMNQKILYLYPAEVVRNAVIDFYYRNKTKPDTPVIDNVDFMTYTKLVNLKSAEFENYEDIDLIIVDECHRLGAKQTVKALQLLLNHTPDAKLLGATATPDRMDTIDEIGLFFSVPQENDTTKKHYCVSSEYTLHNAFQDDILQRPYYCFCSYTGYDTTDIEKATRLEIDKLNTSKRENSIDLLRSRLIEISNITQMNNIIRTTCDDHAPSTTYMKFIVFFSSHKHLNDQKQQVIDWYQSAYPKHKIRTLTISSESKEFTENTNRLHEFKPQGRTKIIDLVFSCDMLNMGYHVDNLTGIMMYRGTASGIIFIQQLGRVLSTGNEHAGIVFDVVDNIHREALYDVLGHQPKATVKRKKRYAELLKKEAFASSYIDEHPEEDTTDINLTDTEMAELAELKYAYEKESDYWWKHANDIQPSDLVATSHEATYRELIAKTVAEPISIRCRLAWKLWIEKGGNPYDKDAVKILQQTAPTAVPLGPFCRLKSVTIEQVLNEMNCKNIPN